jgi:RNA polymerase sigma factor (sigma-70 family)
MSDGKDPSAPAPRAEGLFQPTRWSVVLRAQEKSEVALGELCATYRRPLLIWLQAQGVGRPDAEDLIQGYFAHLLSRDFLGNVAREKGAFRTFLLRCLKNFIRDQIDKGKASKRGGGLPIESLDETIGADGQLAHQPSASGASPDLAYDRAWAQTVLDRALKQLEAEAARTGHAELCVELTPVMFADETAGSYAQIAARLGMTVGAVTTAAHRLRFRLKVIIREEILQTVATDVDWQGELSYLIQLFSR